MTLSLIEAVLRHDLIHSMMWWSEQPGMADGFWSRIINVFAMQYPQGCMCIELGVGTAQAMVP
jgi:hypothetical protein